MERKYSISEIDALRRVCRDKVIWGRFGGPVNNQMSRSFGPGEIESQAEDMVRTYMMAGLTASEILAEERAMYKATFSPSPAHPDTV